MRAAAALLLAMTAAGTAAADDVVRHPIPGSDFPISRAVEVPGGTTLVYLSGVVPTPTDETTAASASGAHGNTQVQTVSVLLAIEETLADLGLAMGDVVKMQVFLVAPEGETGMDFEGFMAAYTQFFGRTDQPRLPARTVVEVAGLAHPEWLVEIEVAAVRPAGN
jgi:enamine deaminase RidA (YjgF/YER057c/UK114 family)